MLRWMPLWLAIGCVPAIPEAPVTPDPDGVEDPDPACADTFDVRHAWSAPVDDYGMIRGADTFDLDGTTFVHSGGAYQTQTRIFDVATGRVLSEETADNRRLVVRDFATDTDLVHTDEGLQVRRASTGRLRGTIPGVWGWLAPSAALDGHTIAVLQCDDTERGSLATFDLDARPLASASIGLGCSPWATTAVDFDEARGVGVRAQLGSGALVDMRSGDIRQLTPHDPGPDGNDGVGSVHDVAFSPSGDVVATGGMDGRVMFHDTDTGVLLAERAVRVTHVNGSIYVQPDTRTPFAWSPDGRLLARALAADTIVVERLCDGAILQVLDIDPTLTPPFMNEGAAPATLHFSPDGRSLIAAYEGGLQGFVDAAR